MSWLRWWEGTCSDPKWRVIAARSGQNVGMVVSVWAWLLEQARPNDGQLGEIDCEEIGITYGYEAEQVASIVQAMADKGLVEDCTIKNWRKRQPKREDDSRERVTEWRRKKAEERNALVTHGNAPEAEAEAEAEADKGIASPTVSNETSGEARPNRKRSRTIPKPSYSTDFQAFWKGYPADKNMSKSEAWEVWQRLDDDDRRRALAALPAFSAYCRDNPDYRPVHAVRFLNKRRFDGYVSEAATAQGETPVPDDSPIFRPMLARYRREHGADPPVTDAGWMFPTAWVSGAEERMRAMQ